jgi:hypothetical protein
VKGRVVSLRDALGLHTGWLVLDSDGRELGRSSEGRGLRGDAEQAVASCLAEGRKVKLGELMGIGVGLPWFPWSTSEEKTSENT